MSASDLPTEAPSRETLDIVTDEIDIPQWARGRLFPTSRKWAAIVATAASFLVIIMFVVTWWILSTPPTMLQILGMATLLILGMATLLTCLMFYTFFAWINCDRLPHKKAQLA